MEVEFGSSVALGRTLARESRASRPLPNREAAYLHLAEVCQLHTKPEEAYEAPSALPSAILSESQTFEQSLLYPLIMECRAVDWKNRIGSVEWKIAA
ncbi:MAG: hypothetical protein OXF86_11030 [Caldilineaceae bacterium]|nr:hypothetical protein [Caldilineaceae bacterium]